MFLALRTHNERRTKSATYEPYSTKKSVLSAQVTIISAGPPAGSYTPTSEKNEGLFDCIAAWGNLKKQSSSLRRNFSLHFIIYYNGCIFVDQQSCTYFCTLPFVCNKVGENKVCEHGLVMIVPQSHCTVQRRSYFSFPPMVWSRAENERES